MIRLMRLTFIYIYINIFFKNKIGVARWSVKCEGSGGDGGALIGPSPRFTLADLLEGKLVVLTHRSFDSKWLNSR